SLVDSSLSEGRHYSIMIYGGIDNLSHTTAERDAEFSEELIELLKINQHSYIVMDSGKESLQSELSPTITRIRDQCAASGTGCWISDGLEIENYLPTNAVILGTQDRTGKQIEFSLNPYEKFDDKWKAALIASGAQGLAYKKRKPRYARDFCNHIVL